MKIRNSVVHFIPALCFIAWVHSATQDQTSSRPNTLADDSDDIQRQLDNEARDRLQYARLKTIWVFHMPTKYPARDFRRTESREKLLRRRMKEMLCRNEADDWTYDDQNKWRDKFPHCGGTSQSPVSIPVAGLVETKASRPLEFCNYDVAPKQLLLAADGKTVTISGEWESSHRPMVTGGAVYSRRYLFHSLVYRVPTEHAVGGMLYEVETQAMHYSADYRSLEEALSAYRRDPQAVLGISTIYVVANESAPGIKQVAQVLQNYKYGNVSIPNQPLKHYAPTFREYACYQGSMTAPPCLEAVLWIIRSRAMPISREVLSVLQELKVNGVRLRGSVRKPLPLNDRRVYYFN